MSMLTDVVLAGVISTAALAASSQQAVRVAERNTAIEQGQYMTAVQAAVNKYIAVNGDVLAGRATGSITSPTGTAISLSDQYNPTIADLINNGFMAAGYTTVSPASLTTAVVITPTDCPGSGCTLPALITTSQYKDLQGNVRSDLAAMAVTSAGLDGGESLSSDPSQFVSRGAAWKMTNTTGISGSLAMRAGTLTTGYVDTLPFYKLDGSRALTGTMNANGQSIQNANAIAANSLSAATVSATSATATSLSAGTLAVTGNATVTGSQTVTGALTARNVVNLPALAYAGYGCSGNAVTTDPSGQLLSCQSGIWRAATTTNNYYNTYPTTYVYQQPTSRWVTNVVAGQSSGAPCSGFIEYYSDGTSATYSTTAGCTWGGH